jgi:hypothetical protein
MDRVGRVRPEIHLTQSSMPAKSLQVYLQAQGGSGKLCKVTYELNMGLTSDTTYNIDPAIVHGFIYETGSGDRNFSSVELPNIGNLNDVHSTCAKAASGCSIHCSLLTRFSTSRLAA